ncbi:unnamed protein product [Alternaria alternata]
MPLGILQDYKLEHVPGTAPLSELGRIDLEISTDVDRGLLKHDATGQIVLVPQPSDSPNDPYNWPRWKKEMFTLVIAYGCGCVGAPFEALIPASVGDIWHVHERGFRMSIFNLGVLGGINLASPIAGSVIQYGSYRIAMHAMGGAFVVMLLLVFFFMPESAYHRHNVINIDTSSKTVETDTMEKEKAIERIEDHAIQASVSSERADPYVKTLMPWSGYWDHVSFWRTFLRPFVVIMSPVVMWATLLFTICISWLVLISITLSQIFSAPPYSFSVSAVGATNVSSFVASLLATLVAGPIIDGVAKFMSTRNNGTFEPEFRLPVMITYLIFTATGFFAWGQSLYNQDPWPIPVIVCMGLINLGVQLGTTAVVTYVSDCHREQAAEAFAIMNFIKNLFAFGLTFYANDWIAVQGVRDAFYVIGGTTIAVTLATIPMYIYGKRARSWVKRSGVLDSVLKVE